MRKHYTFLVLLFTVFIGNAQIVNIPDATFKAKLLAASPSNGIARNATGQNIKIDINDDEEIQVSEVLNVHALNVYSSSIQNLTGIEAFSNLRTLVCSSNQLTNLDISQNTFLQVLSCDSNQLTNLDITQNTNLQDLSCAFNQLTNLDLTQNTTLVYLDCNNNQLENLILPISTFLTDINCNNNQLENINITQCSSLQNFNCHNNNLTSIDISQTQALFILDCSFNQLTVLDLSNNPQLFTVFCNNNLITSIQMSINAYPNDLICNNNLIEFFDMNNARVSYLDLSNNLNLVSINIKNGKYNDNVIINNTPNLQYICIDEQDNIEFIFSNTDLSNVIINSYCSFEPGGTFYTIQGNNKFDNNSNGCDDNDIQFPNLKFSISDGTNSGTCIANNSGNYQIPVQQGTHTITPVFENPSYFIVSPASATVSFPSATSPYTQDFCISPNGVKNDLEVTIILLAVARPGFDAYYRIIYKNKGNQVANGSLSFTFDDAIMDLVSATPVNDNAGTNSLSWNYANLIPLETREIDLKFNINSPTETPAVNGGDVLDYTATIVGATDETPNDNTFVLNQTVVNSYDPNDKTCLEGLSISPSMVGDYVHYLIRFENTGTYPAENIVVKDDIDITKFDISTLVPLSSSHNFVTRITNTNRVEFIFENINLPFDDANNDGYVAFKIKTKPTLVVGDTFSNTANIYFDYNFPITTNTYVTTVQTLGHQDFEFSSVFSLSPVPTKEVLTITAKESVVMTSVSIYNTLGQLVQVHTNPNESIDISGLSSGNYFIKVISDKGSSTGKFIKE